MPELPEVHALVTDLGRRLTGQVVERFDVLSFSALKTFSPPASSLAGQVVRGVERHGKFLDLRIGEVHLVMHLARAGWMRWREGPPPASSGRPGKSALAARLVMAGDDAAVAPGSGLDITEAGTKKSLAIYLVTDVNEVPGISRLGPDPLDPAFTLEVFAGILGSSGRAQIKGVLRNQSNIAGIGNAYSDEILHTARMSPFKPSAMSDEETGQLYDALQSTLRGALARADGLAASELKKEKKLGMQVHGRVGEACPVCGDTVRQVIFHDSTLQYCPTCQTGGKLLADRVLSRLLK
ncbi:DNA-formamidopyrimidine glycosylase family protein [Subtercola boreus]|uniref:Endonuclease VIII n=1 Tax=Subtercola boreus TaxID=120213 RepID=A0A3E0W9U4_9MICO|nr:DNA-formamidopyrimidine glycosylase family protein [Subtercola boreus]RFA19263.1 endonuclease VIII [Subtercola boreus]RFA19523.1 endonuclease VIII [Subtercola boreus]RFA25889.1 endonuclease VIII [Subtercola boreus]